MDKKLCIAVSSILIGISFTFLLSLLLTAADEVCAQAFNVCLLVEYLCLQNRLTQRT